MANAVDQIFIDGNKIDAPRLCGWIRHGQVAQNGTELNRQHAVRLWKTVRAADPELQKFGEEEDQNNVVPLTALKHIVMSKHLLPNLTDEKLQAVQSQVGDELTIAAACFREYTQAKALATTTHEEDGDVVQNFQNARSLFGSVPKALGWIWTGPKSGRLVVSLPTLVGANSEYFAVSDTNYPRYLDSVFGSADFKRRWTLLCDAWEKNMPDDVPLPMLDRSGPTDFIGFMFFLKHAKGRAGDFAILDSTMIMGFVGLGDLRPVAALLKQAMNSNATAEERRSFGVSDESINASSASSSTSTTLLLSHRRNPPKKKALPEPVLRWIEDLGVRREELPGVKASFRALLEIEITAGALPRDTASARFSASPPVRFRALAEAALASVRDAVQRRLDTLAAPPSSKRARRHHDPEEEDIILKVSEVMNAAGVWDPVWRAYRSDLSNRMLQVKCETTNGGFDERRFQEVAGGSLEVLVHKYKKPEDWPIARRALGETKALYEKRIREMLEEAFIMAGNYDATLSGACSEAASRIAARLNVQVGE